MLTRKEMVAIEGVQADELTCASSAGDPAPGAPSGVEFGVVAVSFSDSSMPVFASPDYEWKDDGWVNGVPFGRAVPATSVRE